MSEKIKSAHISGCVGHSLSTDLAAAMIVFEVGEGEQFALTIPTTQLKWLSSLVTDVIRAAERAGQSPGNVLLRRPKKYSIGNSQELRGQVVLSFDAETPDEALFVLANEDGLKISDGLKKDIMPRLNMRERKAYQTKPELITPRKTIITS